MAKKQACGDCKYWNKRSCPAYDTDKVDIRAFFFNKDQSPICDGEFFKRKKKNPVESEPDMGEALTLLNEKFIFKCPTDTRELLAFNDGHYVTSECKVHETLEETYRENLSSHFVEETLKHLQRSNYIPRKDINKYRNKIPIQNGLFNLLTREVEPFDPEQIYTYKLNIKYNPSAECPTWLKFLNQILRSEDIPLLQEIMGYCVLPAMPFHKIFWFYGTGRNGKDRVIMTLEFILGPENVSHLNLGEFRETRRFSLCQVYAKLLNVSSEPESKYPISTNVLKMMCGENKIHAELKGKNKRIGFTNISKNIIVGNSFPKVNDSSIGFWERVEVLPYPFSFTGKDCIPNIERRWIPEELSGIFNWMLDGLYRLKESGEFSSSRTTEETKAEFMRVSDPFRAWLNDYCIFISVGKVTRDEAYNSYKNYSDELGATPDNARNFYSKMRKTPRIKDYRSKVNGKTERGFQGLTIKTEEERESEDSAQRVLVSEGSRVSSSGYPRNSSKYNNSISKEDITPDPSDTLDTKSKKKRKPHSKVEEAFRPSTCFICRKPLPRDLTDCKKVDKKLVHKNCDIALKVGRKDQKYCIYLDLEKQICKHLDGNERGISNIQLCSLENVLNCDLLYPEPEEGS